MVLATPKCSYTWRTYFISGAVKEFTFSYYDKENLLFINDPYYGNLLYVPQQQPQYWREVMDRNDEGP